MTAWQRIVTIVACVALVGAAACSDGDDATPTGTPAIGGLGELAATVGDLKIYGPVLPAPPADVAAVYFTVVNDSDHEDNLVSASSDIAGQATLHQTVTEDDSSRMVMVEGGIVIPAHGTVRLEPGGFHVMLMGVTDPPVDGDTVAVTLVFEDAGEVTLEVPVRPYADLESN